MIGRILKGIFKSTEETGDNHKDPWLKTRYYKASKEKVWNEVLSTLKGMPNVKVVHESKTIGEITTIYKGSLRTYDMTITIVAMSPLNVSVDIFSANRGAGGDLGMNYFNVLRVQKGLDQALENWRV